MLVANDMSVGQVQVLYCRLMTGLHEVASALKLEHLVNVQSNRNRSLKEANANKQCRAAELAAWSKFCTHHSTHKSTNLCQQLK